LVRVLDLRHAEAGKGLRGIGFSVMLTSQDRSLLPARDRGRARG
jgi:hypothetical protein